MKAELEGFSSIDYPNVVLNEGRNTSIEISLSPAVEDVITVTAEIAAPRRPQRPALARGGEAQRGAGEGAATPTRSKTLQQGLVGGVKPLPIAIPETGKLLFLSGVLPPEKIGVEMEVKGKK